MKERATGELQDKLQRIAIFRVILVTVLFLTIIFLVEPKDANLSATLFLIFIYLLTTTYSFLAVHIRNLYRFAVIQLLIDVVLETLVIIWSEGIWSPFSFLYFFTIISAAWLLSIRHCYVITLLCSFSYAGAAIYDHAKDSQIGESFFRLGVEDVQSESFVLRLLTVFSAYCMVGVFSSILVVRRREVELQLTETETDLMDLQKLHQNILESMNSGVAIVTLSGKIALWNPEAERILKLDENIARENILDILPVPQIEKMISERTIDRKEVPFESDLLDANGEEIKLHFNLSTIFAETGEERGYIIMFDDYTELRRTEQETKERERLAEIGELSANIAHEIRNPLAAIKGSVKLLESEENIAGENRILMEIIRKESDRLNQLLTDFLIYARPKPAMITEFDLGVLLKDTLFLVRQQRSTDSQYDIQTDFKPEEILIHSDSSQLRQVLWNLLLNAIQAMPDGGEISISIREQDEVSRNPRIGVGAPRVLLEIRDTGSGIDHALSKRLFSPFFSTKESGSGLGLSIAQRIVTNLNGFIDIDNRLDRTGAIIIIYLPKKYKEDTGNHAAVEGKGT